MASGCCPALAEGVSEIIKGRIAFSYDFWVPDYRKLKWKNLEICCACNKEVVSDAWRHGVISKKLFQFVVNKNRCQKRVLNPEF